nr:MAG TPA: Regulatory protein-modification, helix-turn-helix, transcriptional regulato, DNA [Caudoviricetes sp.]
MDYDLLKVKMKKNKITYKSMAKMLGITLNGFSNKINQTNSSGFYVDEANLIRKTLNLSREETFTIFFNN